MKQKFIGILFVLFSIVQLKAQDYMGKFGKLSQEEFEMKAPEWDSSAEAVVMFDFGKSSFVESEDGLDVKFERIERIKIFSDYGLEYANVEIPFYHDNSKFEKVQDIQAYVYHSDNGTTKKQFVEKVDFFDEKLNDRWTLRKFSLPNVKVGSVIEFKYTLISPFKFNLQDWYFQKRIPVIYSEYEVRMVPLYEYQFVVQGVSKLDVMESFQENGIVGHYGSNSYKDMVHRYGLKNIPAFRDEEFITSINDYLIKMDFQLYQIHTLNGSNIKVVTTWESLIKELIKDSEFGGYMGKSEKIAQKLFNVDEVLSKSPKERFDFVMNFVKSNYKWNGEEHLMAYNKLNEFLERKQGSSSEINLLLIGLLKAVKIDVLPVISSTRGHGMIKSDIPFLDYFNYVLALANVEGKNLLIDATDLNCHNERIPFRCVNDKGLIIKKDEVNWVGLQSTIPSITSKNIQITVSDSLMTSEIVSSYNEYDALIERAKYGKDKEKLLADLNDRSYDVADESLTLLNPSDFKLPYIVAFRTINRINRIADKIYISPFLNEGISENPLKQEKSLYPVDMSFPKKRFFCSIVTIPDGYKLDHTGSDLSFQNKLYEIDYKVETSGNKVTIKFMYAFKNSIYPPDDYIKLKYYFDEILGKINEKLVLKRI